MENLNKSIENVYKTDDFKNALFINYGGLGDEILFLPCLEEFKKSYPNCKITLALEGRAKGIKQLTGLIDNIIEVDIKAKGIKKYLLKKQEQASLILLYRQENLLLLPLFFI